jgi:hypothetical protein
MNYISIFQHEYFSEIRYLSPIITAKDSGYLSHTNTGLGNVLFQIASVYGLCSTLGLKPYFHHVFSYCHKLKSLFNYDHGTTILRNFMKDETSMNHIILKETRERRNDSYLIDQIKKSNENIVIDGYLENVHYFHHMKDDIRTLFGMDDQSKMYLFDTYPFLRHNHLVCVHYRYGKDILDLTNRPLHYDFYKESVLSIKEKKPLFLLFSDQFDLVDLSIYQPDEYKMIKDKDYMELWIMSLCHDYILSGSTFGWWGCYLNRNPKRVWTLDNAFHSVGKLHLPLD